jgi:hypothetical protein
VLMHLHMQGAQVRIWIESWAAKKWWQPRLSSGVQVAGSGVLVKVPFGHMRCNAPQTPSLATILFSG